MNNQLTSIIAELPEEEDNTNSFRTPKGSSNRSIELDKDSNDFLSKTEYRPSFPKRASITHNVEQIQVQSARVNKVMKKISDDNLFKNKLFNEETAFLPNKIDTIENNEIILEEKPGKMSYNDVFNHFCSLNFENERQNIVVEDLSSMSCCEKMCLKMTKKNILCMDKMVKEREIIFCIAQVNYSQDNKLHYDIFTRIYSYFTGEENCPVEGIHWEKIGLQDKTPKNDLRSTGMFSPLQVLYFIENYPKTSLKFYNFLKSKNIEWLCFVSLLQFTKITMDMLREAKLTVYCNKYKSVINTVNNFFCGLVCYFYSDLLLSKGKDFPAEKVNDYILRISYIALRNPSEIFWKATQTKIDYEKENQL